MKIKANKFVNHSGFTLVELLVVIAIIAVVASISIPIGTRLMNSARATQCKGQMKQTIEAHRLFTDDHHTSTYGINFFRDNTGAFTTIDRDPEDNGRLWANNRHDLLYMSVDGNRANNAGAFSTTKKKYFKTATAKDLTKASVRGGITRDANNVAIGLSDPWGRAYFCTVDRDLDGMIVTGAVPLANSNRRDVELGNDVYFLMSSGPDLTWDTPDDIPSHPINIR